jgi:alkaline phosphatase D
MDGKFSKPVSRRRFLLNSGLAGSGMIAAQFLGKSQLVRASAPATVVSDKMRPQMPCGVATDDITGTSAAIWSRCDRPARMIVEYSTTESFRNAQRAVGPAALENSDFTARIYLSELPASQQIFYWFPVIWDFTFYL